MTAAGEPDDALSGKIAVLALRQYTMAVGEKYPSEVKAEGEEMTRAELADLIMRYLVGMGWVEDD